jgi:hypothetical protein
MIRSEEIGMVSEAIVEARKELRNIRPDKQGHGYKYADLVSIIDMSQPILSKHRLVVIQNIMNENEGHLGIETILLHDSGEYIGGAYVLPLTDLPRGNLVQGMGASITYGRRYALAAILGIAADEDIDGKIPETEKDKLLAELRKLSKGRPDINIIGDRVKAAGEDTVLLRALIGQIKLGTLEE